MPILVWNYHKEVTGIWKQIDYSDASQIGSILVMVLFFSEFWKIYFRLFDFESQKGVSIPLNIRGF